MDFITDLPITNGYDSILVVVDQGLSKGVILLPCNKTITAEGTAKLLLENLYKRFGLPDKLISDRGPQFASKAFIESTGVHMDYGGERKVLHRTTETLGN